MAHQVKHLPVMQETQETRVQSLGREDPWKSTLQPTSVSLRQKSHGQSMGNSPCGRRVRHDLVTEQQDSFQGK